MVDESIPSKEQMVYCPSMETGKSSANILFPLMHYRWEKGKTSLIKQFIPKEYAGNEEFGKDFLELVEESDKDYYRRLLSRCLEEGNLEGYLRIHGFNLNYYWVHLILERDGNAIVMSVIPADFNQGHQNLLDESADIIYFCEQSTYKLLYANKTALAYWGKPGSYLGMTCHEYTRGRKSPCPFCQFRLMEGTSIHRDIWYDDEINRFLRIDCKKMNWYDRPAFAIFVHDITDEVRHRQILEGEWSTLKEIIERIPGGVCVYQYSNGNMTFIAANPAFTQMTGITLKVLRTKSLSSFEKSINSQDWIRVEEQMLRHLKAGTQFSLDYRIGEEEPVTWVHAESRPVRLHDGTLLVYVSFTDITKQKEAERQLEGSRMLYAAAIHGAEISVWEYDVPTNTLSSQKNGLERYGLPLVIHDIPTPLYAILEDSEHENITSLFKQITEGKSRTVERDFWFRTSVFGKPHCEHHLYSVVFDPVNGKAIHAYCIAQDVTLQRMEESRYRQVHEKLLSSIPNSLASYHLNLTTNTFVSGLPNTAKPVLFFKDDTADSFFETIKNGMIDEEIRTRFARDFTRNNLIEAFKNGEDQFVLDYHHLFSEGTIRYMHCVFLLAQNPSNGDVELFSFAFDRTQERINDEILRNFASTEFESIALIDTLKKTIAYRNVNTTSPNDALDYAKEVRDAAKQCVVPDERQDFLKSFALDTIISQLSQNTTYTHTWIQQEPDGHRRKKQQKFFYLSAVRRLILMTKSDLGAGD